MKSTYNRYREYQSNRHQYKVEQIAAPIAMMLLLGFVTKYGWIIIGCMVAFVTKTLWKKIFYSGTKKEVVNNIVNIEKNREDMKFMKTTEQGYLNKNNQKNNGRTGRPGTDYGQWFYEMECMNCGHKYNANGTDIWQRKCPKCQGGRP